MKPEIRYKKKTGEKTQTCQTRKHATKQPISFNKEIKREIKYNPEADENKNTTCQDLWEQQKHFQEEDLW